MHKMKRDDDRTISISKMRVARFLTAILGRPVNVVASGDVPVAATFHTDTAATVYMSPRVLNARTKNSYYSLYGAGLHELGHISHSPCQDDALIPKVTDAKLHSYWNLAEDPRIELKLMGWLPGAAKYIKYTVLEEILGGFRGKQSSTMFPGSSDIELERVAKSYALIAGRSYLPDWLRADLRALACATYGEDKVELFEQLLLKVHAFPQRDKPAEFLPLLNEFASAARDIGFVPDDNKCGGGKSNDPQNPSDDKEEDGDPEDGDPEDGEEKPDGPQVGVGKPGLVDPASMPPVDDETRQRIREKVGELLKNMEEDMDGDHVEDYEIFRSEAFGDGSIRMPLPQELDLRDEVIKSFKLLESDARAGFDLRRAKGRLNVKRVVRQRDAAGWERRAFDKFRPDVLSALNIEVGLIVDCSGSVWGEIEDLEGSLWALAGGIESISGPRCSIWLFGSSWQLAKPSGEKWNDKFVPCFPTLGGTAPLGALKAARSTFKSSSYTKKLLFILTDGAWYDHNNAYEQIRGMNDEGVQTHLLGFGGYRINGDIPTHGHTEGGISAVADYIYRVCEGLAQEGIKR